MEFGIWNSKKKCKKKEGKKKWNSQFQTEVFFSSSESRERLRNE